jgi:hypothetical protein
LLPKAAPVAVGETLHLVVEVLPGMGASEEFIGDGGLDEFLEDRGPVRLNVSESAEHAFARCHGSLGTTSHLFNITQIMTDILRCACHW